MHFSLKFYLVAKGNFSFKNMIFKVFKNILIKNFLKNKINNTKFDLISRDKISFGRYFSLKYDFKEN